MKGYLDDFIEIRQEATGTPATGKGLMVCFLILKCPV
jgi:hypothetical protein